MFDMRTLLIFFATSAALAQTVPQTVNSGTAESLRGVSAISRTVAWASGTHGTYLRTTDGKIWIPEQVPGAETLDFRGVVAFSEEEAFLMSAGPGEQSRIYHTDDAGRHWQLQYTNKNPKGFFDSIVFWDRTHGIVLGDPVPDEAGKLKFELLMTEDGKSWNPIAGSELAAAVEGEGAFAASNSCVAILAGKGLGAADGNIWFATGGKVARVFHSADRGKTWQVFETPIVHGADSMGIFSIAFRDAMHGVIAGGDYKHPERDGPNLAFTSDGGKTWSLSQIFPQAYYSAAAYDRTDEARLRRAGKVDSRDVDEDQAHLRIFLVGPNFVFDLRPPRNPTRISPRKKSGKEFNAVSAYPGGGALIVGSKGTIATIP